ncbi:MAG: GGDEF domain-containing protein [Ruminococcus sp.]
MKSGEGVILCYCDLDHLKYVNDNYGHGEGDWYIRHFSDTVSCNIRQEDVFARIGGDEFCIVLRHCQVETARRKCAASRRFLQARSSILIRRDSASVLRKFQKDTAT